MNCLNVGNPFPTYLSASAAGWSSSVFWLRGTPGCSPSLFQLLRRRSRRRNLKLLLLLRRINEILKHSQSRLQIIQLRLRTLLTCTVSNWLRSCFALSAVGGFVPWLTTVVALPGEFRGRAKLHGHSVITIALVLRYINWHSYGSLVLLRL